MKRAVVTLVRKGGDPYLQECMDSVSKSGNRHIIVECGPEWGQVLYDMRDVADSVAWVDSDDYVYPDVLNRAFELMEKTQVGVVYTDEEVMQDNKIIFTRKGERPVNLLRKFPFTIHHLSITRKGSVSPRAKKCIDLMDTCYDWPIRLDAAINHGVAHLPEVGYVWRKHATQDTKVNKYLGKSLDIVRKEYST